MKKKRTLTHNESSTAFNHAWQNEMNRCLHESLFGFFEFGNEFDFSLNELAYSESSEEKLKNKF